MPKKKGKKKRKVTTKFSTKKKDLIDLTFFFYKFPPQVLLTCFNCLHWRIQEFILGGPLFPLVGWGGGRRLENGHEIVISYRKRHILHTPVCTPVSAPDSFPDILDILCIYRLSFICELAY